MSFKNKLPEWKNVGTEPSNALKTNGFKSGYKPPAGIFNWFWSLVSKAITELQTKSVEKGNLLNADLNEATTAGIYRFNSPVANGPDFQYGQLLVLHGEGDTIAQLAFSYEGYVKYRSGNPSDVGGTGKWSEWYTIYSNRVVVPISNGGTGATTAAGALSTLGAAAAKHNGQHNRLNGADPIKLSDVAYLGSNPIDLNNVEDDTVEEWCNLGSGYCYYAKEEDYGAQPSRYGQLVNLITGADVFQIWHTLPKGPNFIRCGSGASGWVSNWHKIYDQENKPVPAELGVAPALESQDFQGCYYRMVNGVQEWINPPMVANVEYKLTERFRDKPVYAMLIDVSALPNTGELNVAFANSGDTIDEFVEIEGTTYNSSTGTYPLPMISTSDGSVKATFYRKSGGTRSLTIVTWSNLSNYSAKIYAKYTKR